MSRHDPQFRPLARPAFTLLEVLLTLAVMVILAAMAGPLLQRPLATARLRGAADQIRACWTTTRVDAMDSGQTLLFHYAPESNRYRIERMPSTDDNQGSGSSGGSSSGGSSSSATDPSGTDPVPACLAHLPLEKKLPENITFVSSHVNSPNPDDDANPDTQLPTSQDPQSVSTGDWSDPILFYPDGTCSSAQVVLKNDNRTQIQVSLRGLTGVTTIGDAETQGGQR
jgi:prepilin-type N-terminal cleavage/methylation domain-containing protein